MRILMLTDDVQIDRRILLEAESLIRLGHEVILLAEGGGASSTFERIGNVKVERLGGGPLPPPLSEMIVLAVAAVMRKAIRLASGARTKLLQLMKRIVKRAFRAMVRLIGLASRACTGLLQMTTRVEKRALLTVARLNDRAAGHGLRVLRGLLRTPPPRERAMAMRIAFYRPDLIHAHDLPQLRPAVRAKRRLRVPLIYDAHELYPEISLLTPVQQRMLTRREKRYICRADAVITVNNYLAAEMAKRYRVRLPFVVLNATKWPAAGPQGGPWNLFRERFGIAEEHQILLWQGWLSPHRGLEALVVAMKNLPENLDLVFMGYGDARVGLEAMASEAGLAERVHFKDAVGQDELLRWTSSADIGIIHYRPIDLNTYYASPNKLYEYIQAELPIVANDLPYLRDVVGGEGFGVVYKLETPADYVKAISMMREPGVYERCRERLRERKAAYGWNSEEGKLFSIYEEVRPSVPAE